MPTQTKVDLRAELLRIADEALAQGPGFAQSGSVLLQAGEELKLMGDIRAEQELLDTWHRLFVEGELAWGYNLMNPSSPFFHKPTRHSS